MRVKCACEYGWDRKIATRLEETQTHWEHGRKTQEEMSRTVVGAPGRKDKK